MPANVAIPTQNVVPGQLISAVLWNGEFQNIFNNFIPASIDDVSGTVDQMRSQTDPFPSSVIAAPTSLLAEIERIRFTITGIKGTTYWYEPPTKTIAQLNTSMLGHTHTGGADGTQIPTAGLADGAITDAKVTDVSADKLLSGSIPSARFANDTIPEAAIQVGVRFAAGTKLFFANDTAPLGWTVDTTNNDKALRVVSSAASGGSAGGSVPFSTGIALQHAHTVNSHSHDMGNHTHSTPAKELTSTQVQTNSNTPTNGMATIYSDDVDTAVLRSGTITSGLSAFVRRYIASIAGGTSGVPSTNNTSAASPGTDSKLADFAGYQYVNVICCVKS